MQETDLSLSHGVAQEAVKLKAHLRPYIKTLRDQGQNFMADCIERDIKKLDSALKLVPPAKR